MSDLQRYTAEDILAIDHLADAKRVVAALAKVEVDRDEYQQLYQREQDQVTELLDRVEKVEAERDESKQLLLDLGRTHKKEVAAKGKRIGELEGGIREASQKLGPLAERAAALEAVAEAAREERCRANLGDPRTPLDDALAELDKHREET